MPGRTEVAILGNLKVIAGKHKTTLQNHRGILFVKCVVVIEDGDESLKKFVVRRVDSRAAINSIPLQIAQHRR